MGQDAYFILPEDYKTWVVANREEGSAYRMVNGEPMGRAAVCWLTNVDHWRRHTMLALNTMENNLKNNAKLRKKLLQDYGSADVYPKYDNYDAIEVPFVDAIPKDYDGAMGVPITFLDKYNPEQFEILNANDYRRSSSVPCKAHGLIKDKDGAIGQVTTYARILIRNRHPEPAQAPFVPEEDAGAEETGEEEDEGFRPGM